LARQRAQAENALTLLVGKSLADLPPAQSLSEQDVLTDIPAGLPSDLLIRRPDIRAAEQRLKAANANIGAARAAFFPRISLTAGIGTASNALSGLFEAGSRTWSFAPQLAQPIFDAGRNSANLNLAEIRSNIAVADYEKTIQTAFREVSDALAARATLDEEIDAQRLVQDAEAERLKLAEQRYKSGVVSSLEILDAQRELFSAEQTLVQGRLLRLTNAIELYRSLGGGWNETTKEDQGTDHVF
jgi:multidrug efflux system outer membrane protein